MSRLRMLQGLIATVMLSAGLAVVPTVAAGTTQTFTGKVSDAMCGAKHTEGLPRRLRSCLRKEGRQVCIGCRRQVYTLTLRIKRR